MLALVVSSVAAGEDSILFRFANVIFVSFWVAAGPVVGLAVARRLRNEGQSLLLRAPEEPEPVP